MTGVQTCALPIFKSYWIGDFAFDLFRERNDLKEEVKKLKKKVKELEKEAIWCGDDRVR